MGMKGITLRASFKYSISISTDARPVLNAREGYALFATIRLRYTHFSSGKRTPARGAGRYHIGAVSKATSVPASDANDHIPLYHQYYLISTRFLEICLRFLDVGDYAFIEYKLVCMLREAQTHAFSRSRNPIPTYLASQYSRNAGISAAKGAFSYSNFKQPYNGNTSINKDIKYIRNNQYQYSQHYRDGNTGKL